MAAMLGTIPGGLGLWAVVPILPTLQAFVLLVPLGLFALLAALASLRDPRAAALLVQLLWRQRAALLLLAAAAGLVSWAAASWTSQSESRHAVALSESWPMHRGGLARLGSVPNAQGPGAGGLVWSQGGRGEAFYASPAVVGDQIYAVGSTGNRSRIHCFHATGELVWSCRPDNYRATFSSPVITPDYLLCGEGLHDTRRGRLVCVDLRPGHAGRLLWTHATNGHVECTPAVEGERVFFGAGDDGVYCLDLDPTKEREDRVVWHVPGSRFPDAETSLVVHEGKVYVGLGIGGQALCVLDAATGEQLHRIELPFPVFGPPSIHGDKLYVGIGGGNFIETAKAGGQVCCLDLRSRELEWTFETAGTVLGAVAVSDGELVFACWDGQIYVLDLDGNLLRSRQTHAPIVSSPAVTPVHIYAVNQDGMLVALERRTMEVAWEFRIGDRGRFLSSPVVSHGSLFVGTERQGFVRVGRPARVGSERWSGPLGGPGAAGCRDDSRLSRRAEIAWRFPMQGANRETLTTAPLITAPVAAASDRIVVPLAAGPRPGLACLEVSGSKSAHRSAPVLRWRFDLAGGVWASPVIADQRVFFVSGQRGDEARQVYGLDFRTGAALWRKPVHPSASGTLSVDARGLLVSNARNTLSSFDLAGELQWSREFPAIQRGILGSGAIVLASTADPPALIALDRPTGATLWQVRLNSQATTPPIARKALVYLGTSHGLQIRSLVDGRVLSQTARRLGGVSGPVHVVGGQFAFISAKGKLIVGRTVGAEIDRVISGARAGTHPLVARQALLFSGERELRFSDRSSPDSAPIVWCGEVAADQITSPPVLHGDRVYFGVADRGLLCLRGIGE